MNCEENRIPKKKKKKKKKNEHFLCLWQIKIIFIYYIFKLSNYIKFDFRLIKENHRLTRIS